ncbi:hypothetical protein [Isoptericola sp. NPDC056134]|uniref:hypothetical protein n=1 Tax=Isoptericola sp. NPDC056134 TaxID=3345723 RepID=UPI0035E49F8F
MSTDQFEDEYTRQLHDLIDGRMSSGRNLATAAARVRDAREALREQEKSYTVAYDDALRAGWTDAELKRVFKDVGVEAAARGGRRKGTSRRRSSAATTAEPVEPVEEQPGPEITPGDTAA